MRSFLADDEVDAGVNFARRDARVLLACRHLHDAANRQRRRLLAELGPEIDLGSEIEIADVVASPPLVHKRIAIDDAARLRVAREERPDVAVDPCVEEERSEDLGAILQAHAERAGKVADVREALDVVRAAAIAGDRDLSVWQNL